jgi:ubiquinone/menaquinone biosynthesis C-methylase UbiE
MSQHIAVKKPDANIAIQPLESLDYFVEWGGKAWENLVAYAISEFVGTYLEGQHILDLGTRSGKMACLFALLGGTVTGIDIQQDYLLIAQAEAQKWAVSERTNFIAYDGNLDMFPDQTFDLVFTKSVLVVVPQLESFLQKIAVKLKPRGKVVLVENAKGGGIVHALRAIRHRRWDYRVANYFTDKELKQICNTFKVEVIRQTRLPPIYLVLGSKKEQR